LVSFRKTKAKSIFFQPFKKRLIQNAAFGGVQDYLCLIESAFGGVQD
jgi:hypothetical protein